MVKSMVKKVSIVLAFVLTATTMLSFSVFADDTIRISDLPTLYFVRSEFFDDHGNTRSRDCYAGSTFWTDAQKKEHIQAIYSGTYNSTYTGFVPNALIIEIKIDSGVTFLVQTVVRENGGNSVTDRNDRYGYPTPRVIGAVAEDFHDVHYLIIDRDTNKVVDFDSPLNLFYIGRNEVHDPQLGPKLEIID